MANGRQGSAVRRDRVAVRLVGDQRREFFGNAVWMESLVRGECHGSGARAERLLGAHSLRAADALQLAAALIACAERTAKWSFHTSDRQLAVAAARDRIRCAVKEATEAEVNRQDAKASSARPFSPWTFPGIRPPLFPADLLLALQNLRAFRHVVRHACDLEVSTENLEQVILRAEEVASIDKCCSELLSAIQAPSWREQRRDPSDGGPNLAVGAAVRRLSARSRGKGTLAGPQGRASWRRSR